MASRKPRGQRSALVSTGCEVVALVGEGAAVVALRLTKLGIDKDRGQEAKLMVSEKIAAALELRSQLVAGKLGKTPAAVGRKVLRHYLRGVRANRRRLWGQRFGGRLKSAKAEARS